MKSNNEQPFKISIQSMNAIAFITVVVNVISERLGTYPSYSGGRFSQMEMIGIFIPIMILITPLFVKKYRKECWNINALIITSGVMIISLLLITVMYANKNFYRILWIEEGHWTRDNCPPIRWDFWNIIGKSTIKP